MSRITEEPHPADFAILQSKIRERFFELGIKRKQLNESETTLRKLDSEKHTLSQKVERMERELSDVNIHLQVAIKAAREAEAERSTARERMAREGAQLEAASKEREHLQESNRNLQLELDKTKRELEETRTKMLTQSHYLELTKKKEAQIKATIDNFAMEVVKFTEQHHKLRNMNNKVMIISKIVTSILSQKKKELAELHEEKFQLQKKVISLTAQVDDASKCELSSSKHNLPSNPDFSEWEESQAEMKKRLESVEEENIQIQASLNQLLLVSSKLQASESQLLKRISELESELNEANRTFVNVESKETQTFHGGEDEANLGANNAESRPTPSQIPLDE